MSPELVKPQPQALSAPATAARSGEGKLLIVGHRCGRLGNRLALFANLIAFAEEHRHRVINVTFHSYAALFEVPRRDVWCQYPVPARRSWLDVVPGVASAIRSTRVFYHVIRAASLLNERRPLFGKRVVTLRERPKQLIILLDSPEIQARIQDARVVFLYGWIFRAPEAMRRHAEKIRAYFRPIAEHERAIEQAVAPMRQKAEVVVGVHIRHADQRTWRGGSTSFRRRATHSGCTR